MKLLKLSYSLFAYLFFLGVFNYLVIFIGGDFLKQWIPFLSLFKTVDSGAALLEIGFLPVGLSNLMLLLAFSLQHSVMARLGVKKLITKFIPESSERSTFVLMTCLVLVWMYSAWQPQTTLLWSVEGGAALVLAMVFVAGAALVLWSTFMISHWRLFGIAQAWHDFRGTSASDDEFSTPALYKYSRHPMYVGILIVMWATPQMTVGHLLLAAVWSAYVFVGIYFEERDLVRQFGSKYLAYQREVSKLLPIKWLTKRRPVNAPIKAKLNS